MLAFPPGSCRGFACRSVWCGSLTSRERAARRVRHGRSAARKGDEVGVRRLERSARRVLDRLHEQFGTAGLVAAAAIPGLGAMVDQHAAAVRDILTTGVESGAAVAGTVLLAGYAQGVLDHLRESGTSLHAPQDSFGWL